MRKVALIPLILIALLVAAGCGGGSGGSGSAESSSSAEAAWAKEVQAVLSQFENHVSSRFVESINTSSAQHLLEPLYRAYAIHLAKLTQELEATKAPAACVATRKKIAADARRYAELNKELGEQQDLSQEEFSFLVEEQGIKIGKAGHQLTTLTARPSC